MTISTTNQISKPVLRKGSTGETVKELQKLLLHYGVYVYINDNGACDYPGEELDFVVNFVVKLVQE